MLSPELKNALQTTRLNSYLDSQELEMLIKNSSTLFFSADEIILQQGKKSDGLYIIIEGSAIVTAKVLGEGTTHLLTLTQGNFFGEISVIERGPCPTSVTAKTDTQCLLIKTTYFDMLSLFYPKIKYQLIHAITDEVYMRLKDIYHKIILVMQESHMATQSLFGAVIKSFTKPTEISLKETGLNTDMLKTSCLFELFTEEEFDELLQNSILIKTSNQCTLIQESEKNPTCYIILRGAVQSNIIHEGKVAKLSVLGPMTLFSSITIIDKNVENIISYTSCERTILLKINESALMNIQENNIQLWYKLFDLICKAFIELQRAAEKLDIRLHSELYNR